ncbi:ABC transporter substrate-binding protein [Brachybacterium huguangmaarense]
MTIQTSRRTFLRGSALVGGIGALAACGQQSSDQQAEDAKKKNEDAAKEQAALPSTAWERMDYDQVPDGGTLTLSVSQMPDNWNAFQTDGNLADRTTIMAPCESAGYKILEDGAYEFDPDFIESAEITSEEPMIVTVKYNPKAVWSDGTPITIADLASLKKAVDGSNEAYLIVSSNGWEQIKEIRQTADEFTGEIEFTSPYADWATVVYPGIPSAVTATPEAFNTGYVSQPCPSAGPFVVSNIDATGNVITLTRNEKWWGRAPKLETIVYRVLTQQQQPSAFSNAEIDALDIQNGDILSQAEGRSDAAIQKSNGLTYAHLTINSEGAGGILADVKVREAIARAIDREAVGRVVVGPMKAPIVLKDNAIFMPGQEGYEDSYPELVHDPEAAGKILDEAGWVMDGDVRKKDGKELAMGILTVAETKSNNDRCAQMMQDLNKIGFKVTLDTASPDDYFKNRITPGAFDLVSYSWVGTAFPQDPNLYYPHDSPQNRTKIDMDAELKDPAEKMLTTLDEDERRAASNEFSKLALNGFGLIPLYATPIVFGVKEGVVNYGASQFETSDWTMVGIKA